MRGASRCCSLKGNAAPQKHKGTEHNNLKSRFPDRPSALCGQLFWEASVKALTHMNGLFDILRGILSSDEKYIFVSAPRQIAISDVVRRKKGRSSHKLLRNFPRCAGAIGIVSLWEADIS